jgi:predicted ATPase
MLEKLEVRSFKALTHALIPLQPLTALIGPNGAGKSTILQALDLMGSLVRSTLPDHLAAHEWEYADLPHLKANHWKIQLVAHLRLDSSTVVQWSITLGARRHAGIAAESVTEWIDGVAKRDLLTREGRSMKRLDEKEDDHEEIQQTLTSSWLATLDIQEDAERFPTLLKVAQWARGIRGYFFLDPLKLRARNRGERDDIGANGEMLAAFLSTLRRRDKAGFDRVVERVQRQYPQLIELSTPRTKFGWTELQVTERWNGEQATFNARQVSDGLLRMIAVSAMHELPERPTLLLLDEIENGLHPRLLGGLVALVRELVNSSSPGAQVLFTTHSPLTVNFLEDPEEVVLVRRGKHGQAVIRALSEVKNIKELRKHFDLGELWYNVGEARLR